MEITFFGYKSIAECFNNYFASVFVQDILVSVIQLNQSPETYFDDIQFSKNFLSGEINNIVEMSTHLMESVQNF